MKGMYVFRASGDPGGDGSNDHLSSNCAVDQYALLASCIKDKKDASCRS